MVVVSKVLRAIPNARYNAPGQLDSISERGYVFPWNEMVTVYDNEQRNQWRGSHDFTRMAVQCVTSRALQRKREMKPKAHLARTKLGAGKNGAKPGLADRCARTGG